MARTKQGGRQLSRRTAPAPAPVPPPPAVRKSARNAANAAKAAAAANATKATAAAAAQIRQTAASRAPAASSAAAAAFSASVQQANALAAQQLAAANAKAAALTQQLQAARSEFDAARRLHQNEMELTLQEEVRRLHEQHQRRIKEAEERRQQSQSQLLQSQSLIQPLPSVGEDERKEESPTDAAATDDAAPSSSFPSLSLSVSLSRSASLPYSLPLPPHWPSTQAHHVSLQIVPRDSADFLMVQNLLHANNGLEAAKTGVLQVQRVFNRPLWERYTAARHCLMHKTGNESLRCAASMGNEQLLFHGTRQNQPHLIYATADGFDVRMAGQGMYGPGLYFSRSAAYSGQSYAHPLQPAAWSAPPSRGYAAAHLPAIPPLFSACPKSGKLKAEKIPPNSFQMFLARVALGTSYDARKNGAPSGGFHGARPPLRPFSCPQCAKHVDLNQINIDVIKDTLAAAAAGESADGDGDSEALGDTLPANAQANRGKRKRGSSAAAAQAVMAPLQQMAATSAASAGAFGTAVGTAFAAAAGAAVSTVATFMPRKTRRQAFFFNCFGNVSSTKLSDEVPQSSSRCTTQAREVATLLFDQSRCSNGEQGDQQCAELQPTVDAQPAAGAVRGREQAEDGAAEFRPEGDSVRSWPPRPVRLERRSSRSMGRSGLNQRGSNQIASLSMSSGPQAADSK